MLSDLTIKGATAELVVPANALLDGELTYSMSQVTNITATILDQPTRTGAKAVMGHMDDGADSTIWGLTVRPDSLTTGGTNDAPTISIGFKSRAVTELEKRTGGHSWGKTSVAGWAKAEIRAVNATPLVQHDLGEREIERKEPEGDHQRPESSWDVLAHVAKQVGARVFDTGNEIVLAKPSWLVTRASNPRYDITWNTWKDHTDALLQEPQYRVNFSARPWEGRETLTLTVSDTEHGPAQKARPGHTVNYTGKTAPVDPVWIITEVRVPAHHDQPVTITCTRPVDPPEIVDDAAEGDGDAVAGTPTGPIGQAGWAGDQLKNASEIVREGQRRNLPTLAYELAVATAMGESSLRNIKYGDVAGPDSLGLFQQRAEGWGSASDRLTPSKSAGFYYTALVATDYKTTAANGGTSVVYGTTHSGTPAINASLTIHNVQRNADPAHYTRFWADAKLVVKACIDAGNVSTNKATGPLGVEIDRLMTSYEGRSIDVDGAYGAQCVDLAAKYITDLFGIPMQQGNGRDYWRMPGLLTNFVPVAANQNPRKGDVVSWSGASGAYPNGGYGHVAIYSHTERGIDYYLSQNPGPSRVQPLSRSGVQGWMRPIRGTRG